MEWETTVKELQGKAAIVTVASRGIGAATAEELAKHGVAVVLAARSRGEIDAVAEKINAAGGRASAIACDVARYADVAGAVPLCKDTYGRLDILGNHAGVIDPIGQLGEYDPDGWDAIVDIHLKGDYHGLRAALPAPQRIGQG